MKNAFLDALKYRANQLDWMVDLDEEGSNGKVLISFYKFSPAGEDFGFGIWVKPDANILDIMQEIRDYADDFDPEEHATMWYRAEKRGQPDSIRDLLEDADAIKAMIFELEDSINEIELSLDNKSFTVNLAWFMSEFFEDDRENPKKLSFEEFMDSKTKEYFDDVYRYAEETGELNDEEPYNPTEFEVCIRVIGRFKTTVKSRVYDIDKIKAIAEERFSNADFGELEDIDGEIRYIEDESGKRIFEDI